MPLREFKQLPPEVVARAVPAAEGTNEVAWLRADAMTALACFADSTVATLGIDVLRRSNGRTEHTYDIWTCEPFDGELWRVFAERSRRLAEEFMLQYPDPDDGSIVYVLVFRKSG
jgi:hypothetical protein